MHTKNSIGHSVSLLNESSETPQASQHPNATPNFGPRSNSTLRNQCDMQRSYSNHSTQSMGSSPCTPGLQRSNSYDSNITNNDPITPITPLSMREMGRQSSYPSLDHSKEPTYETRRQITEIHPYPYPPPILHLQMPLMRSMYGMDPRDPIIPEQPLYGQDIYNRSGMLCDRGVRRYPCRYRDSHSCEKTFTTSGHASRHSKIHSAEKAVHCSHPGCLKKFTRSDNMKQHLETHNKHNKDRSRNQYITFPPTLTRPAGIQKSLPSRPSSPFAKRMEGPEFSPYYPNQGYEYPSPAGSFTTIDHQPRPMIAATDNSSEGLDTLAAVADQMQHQS